jgi:hypothetical protein
MSQEGAMSAPKIKVWRVVAEIRDRTGKEGGVERFLRASSRKNAEERARRELTLFGATVKKVIAFEKK